MSDITSNNLALAFLDQKVAGQFRGVAYAYIAVIGGAKGWQLGIAVKDEKGYNPITGADYDTESEATTVATGMNEHIGLSPEQSTDILISSMRGTNPAR